MKGSDAPLPYLLDLGIDLLAGCGEMRWAKPDGDPGEAARDFLIQGPADHGIEGLVNLFGIESPGLTASLAIAEKVVALLG